LARQHGLQVWMTEVSNGRANTLDSMRGRAIHIHDELRYAGVSSYWAMFQAWDTLAMRGTCDEDCLVNFNRARGTVTIGGTGHAIGHFARWVRRGAHVVSSEADDPLVLVSAFRDDKASRLIAVVINNDGAARAVALSVEGRQVAGDVRGEQSSAAGHWLAIDGAQLTADGRIALVVPGHSVTSVSVALR
jgi:O-glycosyl hydrolase